MRHAFIILAHNEWQILGKVLEYLNHKECDLFLNTLIPQHYSLTLFISA